MAAYLAWSRVFCNTIFELLENSSWIIRGLFERIKNTIAHLNSGLKSCLFAAVLPVGEVFGELIPFSANTESPTLEGCGLVRITGNISLGHILIFLVFDDGWSMVDSCRV